MYDLLARVWLSRFLDVHMVGAILAICYVRHVSVIRVYFFGVCRWLLLYVRKRIDDPLRAWDL